MVLHITTNNAHTHVHHVFSLEQVTHIKGAHNAPKSASQFVGYLLLATFHDASSWHWKKRWRCAANIASAQSLDELSNIWLRSN
eukprot:1188387-Ditylum_brightwellii.AAC.2